MGADNLPFCDTRINRRRGLLASGTILLCQRCRGRSALRRQRARRGGGSGGGESGSGSRMLWRGRSGNLATRGRSVHTAASHSNALCVCSANTRFFFSAMAPAQQCKFTTLSARMHGPKVMDRLILRDDIPNGMPALSRARASTYAALVLHASNDPNAPVCVRRCVGPEDDEVILTLASDGMWLLYVGGSDTDNFTEWLHNAAVAVGAGSFDAVVNDLRILLKENVPPESSCTFVGYSRGAAIVLALADATDKDDYVITLGDPGLVLADDPSNVTALYNEFDMVFGLVRTASGTHEQVSKTNICRKGWFFEISDFGTHTNYAKTLQDEVNTAIFLVNMER